MFAYSQMRGGALAILTRAWAPNIHSCLHRNCCEKCSLVMKFHCACLVCVFCSQNLHIACSPCFVCRLEQWTVFVLVQTMVGANTCVSMHRFHHSSLHKAKLIVSCLCVCKHPLLCAGLELSIAVFFMIYESFVGSYLILKQRRPSFGN